MSVIAFSFKITVKYNIIACIISTVCNTLTLYIYSVKAVILLYIYAVKDVDDRMKCENVGKYMTFLDYSKKIKACFTKHHIAVTW